MEKLTQRKEMNEPSDGLSAAYDFIEGSILEIDQQQRKFVDCTCTCTSASFDWHKKTAASSKSASLCPAGRDKFWTTTNCDVTVTTSYYSCSTSYVCSTVCCTSVPIDSCGSSCCTKSTTQLATYYTSYSYPTITQSLPFARYLSCARNYVSMLLHWIVGVFNRFESGFEFFLYMWSTARQSGQLYTNSNKRNFYGFIHKVQNGEVFYAANCDFYGYDIVVLLNIPCITSAACLALCIANLNCDLRSFLVSPGWDVLLRK